MAASEIVNVARHLSALASRQPDLLGVAFPHGRDSSGKYRYLKWSYRELDSQTETIARGLVKVGIGRGVKTALMVTPSPEFFALVFALFRVGAVPVIVDPGIGLQSLKACLNEAEPTAFIGIPKAQIARRIFGWAKHSIKISVTVGGPSMGWWTTLEHVRKLGAQSQTPAAAETHGDETAAILFTSGSTGIPKGVVYTHAIFQAQIEMLQDMYGIEPGEIDVCTFPLFALFAPALGMSAIIPEMDFTRPAKAKPENLLALVNDFHATNMFGSPALLDRLGRFGVSQNIKMPTVRRIISAGAPVQAPILERMSKMLSEDSQIFTPYGATESLPVALIGSHEILRETRQRSDRGEGVCVGKPVDRMEVKVIRITEDPIDNWSNLLCLPVGQIGEIVVKGPVVTSEYYHRPESTKLAKINDGASIRHRMGDVGYFDEAGRLWFCGRKSHRVLTATGPMFTITCEGVFNTHPNVKRSALVGIASGAWQTPVICVELDPATGSIETSKLFAELAVLAKKFPHTANIGTFLVHPSFPVDIRHNAKIFREKLAKWATEKLR